MGDTSSTGGARSLRADLAALVTLLTAFRVLAREVLLRQRHPILTCWFRHSLRAQVSALADKAREVRVSAEGIQTHVVDFSGVAHEAAMVVGVVPVFEGLNWALAELADARRNMRGAEARAVVARAWEDTVKWLLVAQRAHFDAALDEVTPPIEDPSPTAVAEPEGDGSEDVDLADDDGPDDLGIRRVDILVTHLASAVEALSRAHAALEPLTAESLATVDRSLNVARAALEGAAEYEDELGDARLVRLADVHRVVEAMGAETHKQLGETTRVLAAWWAELLASLRAQIAAITEEVSRG